VTINLVNQQHQPDWRSTPERFLSAARPRSGRGPASAACSCTGS